jgi:hypothetical protein
MSHTSPSRSGIPKDPTQLSAPLPPAGDLLLSGAVLLPGLVSAGPLLCGATLGSQAAPVGLPSCFLSTLLLLLH